MLCTVCEESGIASASDEGWEILEEPATVSLRIKRQRATDQEHS